MVVFRTKMSSIVFFTFYDKKSDIEIYSSTSVYEIDYYKFNESLVETKPTSETSQDEINCSINDFEEQT
mgnify:FL=1